MPATNRHPPRLLTAARVLAGLEVRELAAAANVSPTTITRLERGEIIVSEAQRHGCVRREIWERITVVLAAKGVEFTADGRGVRLVEH